MSKMDGHKGKEKDTEAETGRQQDKGPEKGLRAENGNNLMETRRVYLKRRP